MMQKIIRPDAKGRITLGRLSNGVSGYVITETKDHKLILTPYIEIPAREKWLFEKKETLKKVKKGLQDAAEGRVAKKGSFAKFADDEIE